MGTVWVWYGSSMGPTAVELKRDGQNWRANWDRPTQRRPMKMKIRTPPPKASIANETDESGKLHAPSAVRNVAPICEALTAIAPAQGNALEIASGTGQHVLAFAKAMPTIKWQPTEVEHTRMVSIDAYRADSELSNICLLYTSPSPRD